MFLLIFRRLLHTWQVYNIILNKLPFWLLKFGKEKSIIVQFFFLQESGWIIIFGHLTVSNAHLLTISVKLFCCHEMIKEKKKK